MRWSSRLLPALMLATLTTHAAAQTAPACLTEPEMRSLVLYALPDVADQLGKSCSTNLPASAYLVHSHTDLVARYTGAAKPEAGSARKAFLKMAGLQTGKTDTLDDKAVHDLIGIGIASSLAKGIKADDCRVINDVLEQLAPLPPQNMATLIGIALREVGKKPDGDGKTSSPFRICGTEQGQ